MTPQAETEEAPVTPTPKKTVPLAVRRRRLGILCGVLAALLVLGAGFVVVQSSAKHWSAETTVAVLPASSLGPATGASYWDTLSHGQITATVAEILGLGRYKVAAERAAHLSAAEMSKVSITSTAITNTALVTVTATGGTSRIATEVADGVVSQATSDVDQLVSPYAMSVVSQSGTSASQTSNLSLGKFLVVLIVVAIALGIGVQQAVLQLVSLRWRRSQRDTAEPEPGDEEPSGDAGPASPDPVAPVVERSTAAPGEKVNASPGASPEKGAAASSNGSTPGPKPNPADRRRAR